MPNQHQLEQLALEHWYNVLKSGDADSFRNARHSRANNSRYCLVLEPTLAEKIKQTAGQSARVELVIYTAALFVLLYKHNQHPQLLTIPNLDTQGAEPRTNFLYVTAGVNGSHTFREVTTLIRDQLQKGFMHASYDDAQLVKVMAANHVDHPREYADLGIGHQQLISPEKMNAGNFRLFFQIAEIQQEHQIIISYDAGLYTEEYISRLAAHYITVLSALLHQPDLLIRDCNILTTNELQLLNEVFNNTAAPFHDDITLHEMFRLQAASTPDAVAVVHNDISLTYRELEEQSNSIATCLIDHYKVVPEDLIGILTDRSVWMIASILGVLKAGAAYVPIDPEYPAERKAFIFEDTGMKLVITDSYSQLDQYDISRLSAKEDETLLNSYAATPLPELLQPSGLAYVIYTSGSTGKPKGAMLTHVAVVNRIEWMWHHYGFTQQDIILQKTPFVFDVSVWELFMTLCFGARLVLCDRDIIYDPLRLTDYIRANQITTLHFVPGMLNVFLDTVKDGSTDQLGSLRHIMSSGEALLPEIVKKHYSLLDIPLHNLYGPTEAAVDVTSYETAETDVVIPIGKPISNILLYILDRDMGQVPVGVEGELYIAGIGLARGYLNRDELTGEKFINNPFGPGKLYRTGDIACWLPDGNIVYAGRTDQQLKIRGFRVEPGEIENTLLAFPDMEAVAVLAKEDEDHSKLLVAYYQRKEAVAPKVLQDYLHQYLAAYMVPAFYVRLDAFPVTATGKIDRKALLGYQVDSSRGIPGKTAWNDLQREMIAIWEEELKVSGIGIDDDYFALGGDSLKAMRLIIRINKLMGANLEVKDIFSNTTIEKLSLLITKFPGQTERIEETLQRGLAKFALLKAAIEAEDKNGTLLPVGYEDIYSLASIEKGMIYAYLYRSNEAVYHDQYTIEFRIYDVAALKSAIGQLITRHSMLRTRYYLNRFSQPVKVVMQDIDLPFSLEDVRHLDKSLQEAHINSYLQQDISSRFTFDGDILWRMKVFRLTADDYYLVWTFHHALMDGWSGAVFRTELSQLLAANGDMSVLPPLKYSYKDYCALCLEKQITEDTRTFWQQQLGGYTRNKLPFNYTGKKKRALLGVEKVHAFIDKKIFDDIETVSQEQRVSFKSICLAAYICLQHHISSEKEVVIGVVTHDRPLLEDSDRIIGCFLNMLPVRINVQKSNSYIELIKEVNEYLVHAKPHEIHLTEIAAIIGEKAVGNTPVFDCLLNVIDFHVLDDFKDSEVFPSDYESDGQLSVWGSEMSDTLFDLEVNKSIGKGQAYVHIKYHPAYFEERDIAYALKLYIHILELMSKDIHRALDTTDLLGIAEYDVLLNNFNDTIQPYGSYKTLHQLLEEQVLKTPDNTALWQDDRKMTYDELNRKANQLAFYLQEKGVKNGDNVGLLVDRGFEMIIGMYGILKAGAAYVPIDPEYPVERQQYIIGNSAISLVITDGDYPVVKESANAFTFVEIEPHRLADYPDGNPELAKPTTDLAYIIYTSGSTGRPKGVMIPHNAAVNLVEWVNETFAVNENDRLLFITSMCFDLSVYDIFGMLATGGSLVIARQQDLKDVQQLTALMRTYAITCWDSVPSTMSYLVTELEQIDHFIQKDLRLVLLSGDWIPVNLPGRITKCFPNAAVVSLGGATEGTVWSNYYPVISTDASWTSIPYGKPIKNNFFYVLNEHRKPVLRGTVGELYIGGIGVAYGYMNDPEKTKQAFLEDPFNKQLGGRLYKTGDLGRILPDGNMEFLGRIDTQVKIRGFRVEPGEVESQLQKYPGIGACMVAAFKDEQQHNYLCAYIAGGQKIDADVLKAYLATKLPVYMIPAYFISIAALPLNSNGKIDKSALPPPALNIQQVAYTPGRDELEIKLSDIISAVLGKQQIGVFDDIFELGANSLTVGALLNRIHRAVGASLLPGDLFANPTIAAMATRIREVNENIYKEITCVKEQPYYALSQAQRRLLIAAKMDPAQKAYNISAGFRLSGCLDTDILEKVFHALIDRHEILRTVFPADKETLKQQVLPASRTGFHLRQLDLRGDPGRELRVKEILEADMHQPFDLATPPLIRAWLLQTNDEEYVVAFSMHHLISDGWSMQIILKELLLLYNAFVIGKENPLSPLKIQYKDYCAWESEILQGENLIKQEQYWLEQFKGELPYVELPADHPRPPVKTFNGDHVTFVLGQQEVAYMEAMSRRHGASFFSCLLAVVKLLLYKYTGQEDIILGTVVAGRDHLDLENGLGFYVNTLALRTKLTSDAGFADLLGKVKNTLRDALTYQRYPFDMLIERLELPRDRSKLPLFEVMTVLQNARLEEMGIGNMNGITVEEYAMDSKTSKYDLLFNFTLIEEGMIIRLEYNSDLFEEASIRRLEGHFQQLWKAVLDNEYEPVSQIGWLSEEDKKELAALNEPATHYPHLKTIHTLFEEQVEHSPTAKAVVFKDQILTYDALNRQSNRLAHYLKEQFGLVPDDLVGIMLNRSDIYISTILSILKADAGYLPVDASHPQERIRYTLDNAGVKLLITDTAGSQLMAPFYTGNLLVLADIADVLPNYPEHNLQNSGTSSSLAYVMYTSGSTGQPKGVVVEHRSVVRLVKNTNYITTGRDSRLLQTGAMSFDATTFELWSMLLNGGELHLLPDADLLNINTMKRKMWQDEINILWLTTSWCHHLIDLDITLFKKLKLLLVGGELLSILHINKLQHAYPSLQIINVYGPTENTTFSTFHLLNKQYDTAIPIGKSVSNTQVYVMDQQLQLQPVNVAGEICVGGDGLARGYLNNPALTEEKFVLTDVGRVYRTGDKGRWRPDGVIEFLGRQDQQVKIRGYRIELDEIRHALVKHPCVRNAVITIKEFDGEKRIISYVVLAQTVSSDDMKKYLGTYLPAYMIPSYIIEIPFIPLNTNGKTDLRALPPVEREMPLTIKQAPANETERKLIAIWQHLFGHNNIGVDSDFFELGGHSLKGTLLLSYISKELEVDLDLASIFLHPRLKVMARIIAAAQTTVYKSIPPVREQETYAVSHAQKRIWLSCLLPEESITFNIVNPYRIKGALNIYAFERTFEALIKRHESLRTTFTSIDGEPRQKILSADTIHFQLKYIRLDSEEEGELEQLINEQGYLPFDLENGPLLRGTIIEVSKTSFIFLFVIHHIIADAWSMEILVSEITTLYNAFNAGTSYTLPALSIHYKDYAAWQNECLNSAEVEVSRHFWQEKLSGELPVLEFPLDKPRAAIKSYNGDVHHFAIEPETVSRLNELSRLHSTSLYAVLLTGVYVLLYRYTAQKDILIGLPSIGRRHKDLENQIGFYANTIVLRAVFHPEDSFLSMLHQVRDYLLSAQDHDIYPFDRIVEDLRLEKHGNRSFLFDVMVHLLDESIRADGDQQNFSDITIAPLPITRITSKYDLTFSFRKDAVHGRVYGNIIYNQDLFINDTIARLAEDFCALISMVAQDQLMPVKELRKKLIGTAGQEDFSNDVMGVISSDY